jgi:hypothetical protein
MGQTLFSHLLTMIIGFLLALLTMSECHTPKIKYITTVEYKFRDTLIVEKEVPVPITKWITKVEYQKLVDSLYTVDTLISYYPIYKDQIPDSIPVNVYQDSIITPDSKLKWTAETLGYLKSFKPELTINRKIDSIFVQPLKPRFSVGVGMSNKLNLKVSLGYKGWMFEPVFALNPKNTIQQNQLFITKQWFFK